MAFGRSGSAGDPAAGNCAAADHLGGRRDPKRMNRRVSAFAGGVSLSFLSLWLGAAIFFSAVVAPAAFGALRSFQVANMNEIAGTIVTRALSVINVSGVLIVFLLLLLTVIVERNSINASFLSCTFRLSLIALT